jgi:hypothetical protein
MQSGTFAYLLLVTSREAVYWKGAVVNRMKVHCSLLRKSRTAVSFEIASILCLHESPSIKSIG